MQVNEQGNMFYLMAHLKENMEHIRKNKDQF